MHQVIVGFADIPTAHKVVQVAVELTEKLGGTLHVVMATEDDRTNRVQIGSDEWAVSEVESAEASIRNFMVTLSTTLKYSVGVAAGSPGTVLVSEAERLDADLIVVGNVRMQGISRIFGSVGGEVIHHAPCNVLVVKSA